MQRIISVLLSHHFSFQSILGKKVYAHLYIFLLWLLSFLLFVGFSINLNTTSSAMVLLFIWSSCPLLCSPFIWLCIAFASFSYLSLPFPSFVVYRLYSGGFLVASLGAFHLNGFVCGFGEPVLIQFQIWLLFCFWICAFWIIFQLLFLHWCFFSMDFLAALICRSSSWTTTLRTFSLCAWEVCWCSPSFFLESIHHPIW